MEALLVVGLWNAGGAALLALLALGVGRVCRRPALLHALWLLVLLKLVTPPLWPVPVHLPARETSPPPVVALRAEPVLVMPQRTVGEWAPQAPVRTEIPVLPQQTDVPVASPVAMPTPQEVVVASEPIPVRSWQMPWLQIALAIWAAGAAMFWGLTAVRIVRFRRLMRRLGPAPLELQERASRVADRFGLREAPLVCLVAAPISPMAWALGSTARLLVPSGLWEGLSEEQRDLLLAHELAHIARRDHWVRLLELIIVGLYWWCPVAWFARQRLLETAELCCDAWVMAAFPESGRDYAATLVESAAFLSRFTSPVPVGASGLGPVPLLRRRITMILSRRIPRRLSRIGFGLMLVAAVVLLPLWPTLATQPVESGELQESPNEEQPPKQPALEPHPIVSLETQFDSLEHDFGAVQNDKLLTHQFKVTNISKREKVSIESIRTTTSALMATIDKDVLEPGESAALTVQLSSKYFVDYKTASAFVVIRQATKQAEVRVIVAGDSRKDAPPEQAQENVVDNAKSQQLPQRTEKPTDPIAFPPTRSDSVDVDLGVVRRGAVITRECPIYNPSDQGKLSIESVRTTAGALKATISKKVLEPGKGAAIKWQLDTKHFVGYKVFSAVLSMRRGNDPPCELRINVSVDSREDVPDGSSGGQALNDADQHPLFKTANSYFHDRKYAAAASKYKELLEQFPSDPNSLSMREALGECYHNLGRQAKTDMEQEGVVGKKKASLHQEWLKNLNAERDIYQQLADDLDAKAADTQAKNGAKVLSPTEETLRRKALFEVAACYYEMPNAFEEAFKRYVQLVERFRTEPDALWATYHLCLCRKRAFDTNHPDRVVVQEVAKAAVEHCLQHLDEYDSAGAFARPEDKTKFVEWMQDWRSKVAGKSQGTVGPMFYRKVYLHTIQVLSDYGFDISEDSMYEGRIETLPRVAPGSTLQTYRQRVSILIERVQTGGFFINVTVFKEVKDLPRPVRSTAADAIFRNDNDVERQFTAVDPTVLEANWIPKGRDFLLEEELLKRLKTGF